MNRTLWPTELCRHKSCFEIITTHGFKVNRNKKKRSYRFYLFSDITDYSGLYTVIKRLLIMRALPASKEIIGRMSASPSKEIIDRMSASHIERDYWSCERFRTSAARRTLASMINNLCFPFSSSATRLPFCDVRKGRSCC